MRWQQFKTNEMKRKILLLFIAFLPITIYAQSAEELNSQGIEFAKKGKIEKAFKLFNKAIETNPEFSNAYSNRGNVYRMGKKYELAIRDYSTSLKLDPKDLRVLYSRANTYLEMENFKKAIDDYSSIIKLKPTFSNIYFDRAYANIRIDNFKKAKKDLEAQLELNPNDFKSLANLINIKYKLGLYNEALTDYTKIFERFPNQPNLHILYNNRANLYQELDEYQKALNDINKALSINKNYDIGFLNRAGINMKLGNEKEACQDFKKAIELGVKTNDHFEIDDDFKKLEKLCK